MLQWLTFKSDWVSCNFICATLQPYPWTIWHSLPFYQVRENRGLLLSLGVGTFPI